MIIRRQRPEANYTVIENKLIYDGSLDWRELGLLVFLLSKPDNWSISMTHLAKQKQTGKSGIESALKKLQEAGYVSKQRQSTGNVDWYIYDEPQLDKQYKEKPQLEKPDMAKPDMANQVLINTDKEITTEITVSSGFSLPKEVDAELWARYESHRKHLKKPMSDDARTLQSNVLKKLNHDDQRFLIEYSISGNYPSLYINQLEKRNDTHRSKTVSGQPQQLSGAAARSAQFHETNKLIARGVDSKTIQQIAGNLHSPMDKRITNG